MLDRLPTEAKLWAEKLHWKERRYLLSLCHLLCAAPPEDQAHFLDQYTADGLIAKIIQDYETQEKVQKHLLSFHITTELNSITLRRYIRQFYIHSAQDARREPDKFLESALRLVISPEEKNYVLNYILGFELIKMIFQMSWLQQERFYLMQHNQEDFYLTYIKPIQHAHRLNGIINPKDSTLFFAQRNYFVKEPNIPDRKLLELAMVTFTTDVVSSLGFAIVRNIRPVPFDYEFIYRPEEEKIFT
ncbi:cobyrinic acid a,c-diamide synthase [Spirulina sp. CCNP1310]|uniref:cobyrinic acid a,c-diamide synthase n=1 Tax=Spirulina sp. CCNP1310 TaxID=3110249 RepID=UPI002B1EC8A7|nr:cobyrinic acid a,c-diamide synthase [Spirulina sp. CCNP1310]MEA5419164.1 cobyrinic acid a,c-diamide synthase [Spirulina sp. CCNP1310]